MPLWPPLVPELASLNTPATDALDSASVVNPITLMPLLLLLLFLMPSLTIAPLRRGCQLRIASSILLSFRSLLFIYLFFVLMTLAP